MEARPWVRFWARLLDIMLYSAILAFIFPYLANFSTVWQPHIAIQWPPFIQQLAAWGLINLAAYILIETILLSTLGTTLGKWIFHISLKNNQDQKLSSVTAFKRTFLVYWRGLGLLLPFISFITLFYSYAALNSSGSTSWDKECHTVVSHQRIGFLRIAVAIILFAIFANFKADAMGMNMQQMTLKQRMMYVCGIRG
jgi:hypothetical protein